MPGSSKWTAEKGVASTPTPAAATKEQGKWTAPAKKQKRSGRPTMQGLEYRMKKMVYRPTLETPKGNSYPSLFTQFQDYGSVAFKVLGCFNV
jgi:hypothetical protein